MSIEERLWPLIKKITDDVDVNIDVLQTEITPKGELIMCLIDKTDMFPHYAFNVYYEVSLLKDIPFYEVEEDFKKWRDKYNHTLFENWKDNLRGIAANRSPILTDKLSKFKFSFLRYEVEANMRSQRGCIGYFFKRY